MAQISFAGNRKMGLAQKGPLLRGCQLMILMLLSVEWQRTATPSARIFGCTCLRVDEASYFAAKTSFRLAYDSPSVLSHMIIVELERLVAAHNFPSASLSTHTNTHTGCSIIFHLPLSHRLLLTWTSRLRVRFRGLPSTSPLTEPNGDAKKPRAKNI